MYPEPEEACLKIDNQRLDRKRRKVKGFLEWLSHKVSSVSLSLSLSSLEFLVSLKKLEVVSGFFLSSSWSLHLHIYTRDTEIDELSSLISIISPLSPSPSRSDSRLWSLSSLGSFLVSSCFALLSYSSPPSPSSFPSHTIWFLLFPSKIQGFHWKIASGRVLTQNRYQNLNRRSSFASCLPSLFLLSRVHR